MAMLEMLYNKKKIRLKVTRLTIYRQTKIIEAYGKNRHSYYLFCYKNQFINIKKTSSIQLTSYLAKALRTGVSYPADHFLTTAFLQLQNQSSLISNNQMVQQLKKSYHSSEMLYVLAMFDHYIQPHKIQSYCKEAFYRYRRNGQLKKAFQVVLHFAEARPDDTFANDMLQHRDFQKYKVPYDHIPQLIQDWQDPLYIENYIFDQDFPASFVPSLFDQYHQDNRVFDQIYLYYIRHQHLQTEATITNLLNDYFTIEQQIQFWQHILQTTYKPEQIMKHLLSLGAYDSVLHYYLQSPVTVEQQETFELALQSASAEELSRDYQALFKQLTVTYQDDHLHLEKVLQQVLKKLLPVIPIRDILKSIEHTELPIVQKLRNMEKLMQNPDQQYALGELYYDLEQYDQAISCFEWEMELSPKNAAPIQYLYKSHLAKGDKEQASMYKQLLGNIPS